MKCQKCNNEISQNQKFCKYCGTPVNLNNEISSEVEQNNNVTNPNRGMNNINPNKSFQTQNYNNNSSKYQNGNGQNSNYNLGYNTQESNGKAPQNPVYPNKNNKNKSKKVPLIIGGAIAGFFILALIAIGLVFVIK